ncbi:carbohydrate kinase family protein [Cohnella herbarum]|uniref:Carbohydrate kinase family protein n=1 Tax=Cohnella herbarum TaxID=2728023 RepID=A0A7Z2ZNB8_9BACL|nr:carbohydrate kinase family protein [Cohnella herbarum]QJD85685.1 carbohydrate kinase family protein [Cohnella herbarum]
MATKAAAETQEPSIAICGHIAVDIIPEFPHAATAAIGSLLTPGNLVEVGAAAIATGGAVSNTGVALHRLGANVKLIGKVGDDVFGEMTVSTLERIDQGLASGLIRANQEVSSYTLVISPPGTDRIFLHCPGANDTFTDEDVPYGALEGIEHFHFGYPPLMKRMIDDGGVRLERMLSRIKGMGISTSLDMALPGAGTVAYGLDWVRILEKALPHVDLFMPSLEEALLMTDQPAYEDLLRTFGKAELCERTPIATIRNLAERLLAFGCGTVVLKIGSSGLYARSRERELWAPCFKANLVGTTGAGDSTIAGYLYGMRRGLSLERTMTAAVAVGAFSVEAAEATAGIAAWDDVWSRVERGWERLSVPQDLEGWAWNGDEGIWHGPADCRTNKTTYGGLHT